MISSTAAPIMTVTWEDSASANDREPREGFDYSGQLGGYIYPGSSPEDSDFISPVRSLFPSQPNMLWSGSQASKSPSTHVEKSHSLARHTQAPIPQKPFRVFHDDQPYLDLQIPMPSSTIKSILPSPPTSPIPRKTRFGLDKTRLAYSFKQIKALHGRLASPFKRKLVAPKPTLATSPTLWVVLYFTLNLSLTLYNKYVLIRFPFPYTLTALHALSGTAGTAAMFRLGLTSEPPLPNMNARESMLLLFFSMLYTINIVVSNASLKLVTVPFHQVVRGSAPLFTIALSALLFRKGCSRAKLLSLLPVIAGVGLATFGDYYFTLFGFLITILGTLLAALKTIITNLFLRSNASPSSVVPPSTGDGTLTKPEPSPTGLSTKHERVPAIFRYIGERDSDSQHRLTTASSRFALPTLSLTPLQLLAVMSPLAFIQTSLMALLTGELELVNRHLVTLSLQSSYASSNGGPGLFGLGGPGWWLLLNGMMAFALNVVSFNSNKWIGPLGMSVAANVKQVLTVLCAVVLFNLTITLTNGLGIALTLIGGALYAYIEVQEKLQNKRKG